MKKETKYRTKYLSKLLEYFEFNYNNLMIFIFILNIQIFKFKTTHLIE